VKVHEALAAIEPLAAPHDPAPVLLIEKSDGFPPVVVGFMPVAVVPESFVKVNVTGELEEPRLTEPKFSGDGESVTAPALYAPASQFPLVTRRFPMLLLLLTPMEEGLS
jgi:hypothetical protein